MRHSQLFTKTIKELPKDEKSVNSQLLIRAGFIDKLMAGVYSFLPLGFLVLKKIENIVREEINAISGQEVLLPVLHPKESWLKTDRWQYPEMFKLKSRGEKDFSLGWTHEEVITPLIKKFVLSYKDLPVFVYQIQDKFRDELRAKSGLLRGVEFLMKDLYSFHQDEKDLDRYYEEVKNAYFKIFKRCGIGKETFLTLAAGGSFCKYSHEFQTVTAFGEDQIFFCPKCKLAINKEIIEEEGYQCFKCKNKKLEEKKAIETGNIFKLKDKFSQAFNFNFKDKDGKEKKVLMGCYGIGISRLMGTIVEVHHDERGIIWPKEVAPFQVHLIPIENVKLSSRFLRQGRTNSKNLPRFARQNLEGFAYSNEVKKTIEKLYQDFQKEGIEVLYDDRLDKTVGEKFADADLMGIPHRLVVSERTLVKNSVEIKKRDKKEGELVKISQAIKAVRAYDFVK